MRSQPILGGSHHTACSDLISKWTPVRLADFAEHPWQRPSLSLLSDSVPPLWTSTLTISRAQEEGTARRSIHTLHNKFHAEPGLGQYVVDPYGIKPIASPRLNDLCSAERKARKAMDSRALDAAVPFDVKQAESRPANYPAARAELITAIAVAMATRDLSQVQASKLLRTDQPTLSKVLRGRTESVSLDKLVAWLLALGRSVEIRVGQADLDGEGTLTAVVDGRANHK